MRLHPGSSRWFAALAAAPALWLSTAVIAQPLTFSVGPTAAPSGGMPSMGYAVNPAALPPGVTPVGYTQDGWIQVPTGNLHAIGPRYAQPSGVKLRRGSVVPDWIDVGDMQNVSIPGLPTGSQYRYFISPDQRIVVIDPQSRRVMRVMR